MIKDCGKCCEREVRDKEPGRESNICEGLAANWKNFSVANLKDFFHKAIY